MKSCVNEYRVQCRTCSAEIGVRGVPPPKDNATRHHKAVERDSLNELLVDYGWLPTSAVYYCRRHAPQARARLRSCRRPEGRVDVHR
jgi:hypothetical protein